jgi:hypothetical protein
VKFGRKSEGKRGRKANAKLESALEGAFEQLEASDDSQFTMSEVVLMIKQQGHEMELTEKYLRQRMVRHFEDRVHFTERTGQSTILTLSDRTDSIFSNCFTKDR